MLILTKKREREFFGGCIVKKTSGDATVSLYEYPAHARIPRHCHQEPYVSFVLQGGFTEQSAPRQAESFDADAAVLHSANESHTDEFHASKVVVLAVQFTAEWCERAAAAGIQLKRRRADSPEISRLARKLHFQLMREDPRADLSRQGLALELIAELIPEDAPADTSWAGLARQAIHSGFRNPLSVAVIAHQLNLHPAHVARAFRKQFGCTVGDFIRQVRLNHALRRLNESEDPVSIIAAECGFYDQSHFTASFRAAIGTTPKAYRRVIKQLACRNTGNF